MRRGCARPRPSTPQQQRVVVAATSRSSRPLRLRVACFHDKRRSAWNADARRTAQDAQRPALQRQKRVADRQDRDPGVNTAGGGAPDWLRRAEATHVHSVATDLCAFTSGQLSRELALFLLTEQPSLLGVPPGALAGRILQLSTGLDLSPADVADLLIRNPQVAHLLPGRLRVTAQALAAGLNVPLPAALVMLAGDLTLMDVPPLRLQQQTTALARVLGLPVTPVTHMAVRQPALAWLSTEVAQARMAALCGLLELPPAAAAQLLLEEPRLLLVRAALLASNHAALQRQLRLSPPQLRGWCLRAPALLLVEAADVAARLRGLPGALSTVAPNAAVRPASDWQALVGYAARDPRVLLLKPAEARERAHYWSQQPVMARYVSLWLLSCHPSYLVASPGDVDKWLRDVQHLLQLTMTAATQLLLVPELFLSTPVEHMLLVLNTLSALTQQPFSAMQQLVLARPLLLTQTLPALAAAWQQVVAALAPAFQHTSVPHAPAAPGAAGEEGVLRQQRPATPSCVPAAAAVAGDDGSGGGGRGRGASGLPSESARQAEPTADRSPAPPAPLSAAAAGAADGSAAAAAGAGSAGPADAARRGLRAAAAQLVVQHPELLLLAPGVLHGVLQQHADALGVSLQDLRAAAAATGRLLQLQELDASGLEREGLARRAQVLLGCGVRPPGEMLQVLLAQPRLLCMTEQALRSATSAVAALGDADEGWRRELRTALAGPLLGRLLRHSHRHLPKLWYLASRRGVPVQPPLEQVLATDFQRFWELHGGPWAQWVQANLGRIRRHAAAVKLPPRALLQGETLLAELLRQQQQQQQQQHGGGAAPALGGGGGGGGRPRRWVREVRLVSEALDVSGAGDRGGAWGGVGGVESSDAGWWRAAYQVPTTSRSHVGRAQGMADSAARLYGSQEGSLLVWPDDHMAGMRAQLNLAAAAAPQGGGGGGGGSGRGAAPEGGGEEEEAAAAAAAAAAPGTFRPPP